MPEPIVIGQLYEFHSKTEPIEVRVVADGTVVKVLREVESLDPDIHKMYEVVAEGDDDTFPAFDDELLPVEDK